MEFLATTPHVPDSTRQAAMRALLDAITCTVAGHDTRLAQAARHSVGTLWGAGQAAIWLTAGRSTVCGATFANAACISSLDLDDGHRIAAGHPGASIVPTVLATADRAGRGAEDVLTAIAIGYEAAVRISAVRDLSKVAMLVTGHWCGQAAAAAAAWMQGLGSDRMRHAVALGGGLAPNLACVAFTREMGCHLKEAIPFATVNGIMAADLASHGFTGPTDFLDADPAANLPALTQDLGARWAIERSYFKPYSVCRWFHPGIESSSATAPPHPAGGDHRDPARLHRPGAHHGQ